MPAVLMGEIAHVQKDNSRRTYILDLGGKLEAQMVNWFARAIHIFYFIFIAKLK